MNNYETQARQEITSMLNSYYPNLFSVTIEQEDQYVYYRICNISGKIMFEHVDVITIVKWMHRHA